MLGIQGPQSRMANQVTGGLGGKLGAKGFDQGSQIGRSRETVPGFKAKDESNPFVRPLKDGRGRTFQRTKNASKTLHF